MYKTGSKIKVTCTVARSVLQFTRFILDDKDVLTANAAQRFFLQKVIALHFILVLSLCFITNYISVENPWEGS